MGSSSTRQRFHCVISSGASAIQSSKLTFAAASEVALPAAPAVAAVGGLIAKNGVPPSAGRTDGGRGGTNAAANDTADRRTAALAIAARTGGNYERGVGHGRGGRRNRPGVRVGVDASFFPLGGGQTPAREALRLTNQPYVANLNPNLGQT